MKSLCLILAVSVFLYGCSSSYYVSSSPSKKQIPYEEFNRDFKKEEAKIFFIDGKEEKGRDVSIVGDSIKWTDQDNSKIVVRSDEVERIERISHCIGTLEGLSYGLPIGFVAGYAGGSMYPPLYNSHDWSQIIRGGIIIAVVCSTITIIGSTRGHKYIYYFEKKSENESENQK